jgi:uncharacterized membrane protein
MSQDGNETAAQPAQRPAILPVALSPVVHSHARALAKGVTWRIIGTLDTFLWSWLITHQPVSAGAIAGTEVFTKIGLFYLHERLWRLILWSPNGHLRSLIKAISWRLVGSLDTFILSLIFTGSARYAVSIATAEALTKIVLYYLHERSWRMIAWGRLEEPSVQPEGAVQTPRA